MIAAKPNLGTRALRSNTSWDDRPRVRTERMNRARFSLYGDVSQCYSSMYTHSIEWALHGKAASKLALTGGTRRKRTLGSQLDAAIQHGQWGQTKGIPIGPDTSHALAEVILCAIDDEVQKRNPMVGSTGLRFMDDLEVFAPTRQELEDTLLAWETALAQYELEINPLKTRIAEGPQPVDPGWRGPISQFRFRDGSDTALAEDLRLFFGMAFLLAREQPHESIIGNAIGECRRRKLRFGPESWHAFMNLLLPSAIAEPSALRFVWYALDDGRRKGRAIPDDRLEGTLNELIRHHAPLEHGSEVTWALWILAQSPARLEAAVADSVAAMQDNAARIVLQYVNALGKIDGTPDLSPIELATQQADALVGPDWLLAYESARKGWCSDAVVKSDPFFEAMLANKVEFFHIPAAAGVKTRGPKPSPAALPPTDVGEKSSTPPLEYARPDVPPIKDSPEPEARKAPAVEDQKAPPEKEKPPRREIPPRPDTLGVPEEPPEPDFEEPFEIDESALDAGYE
jgi:hypothetical protein